MKITGMLACLSLLNPVGPVRHMKHGNSGICTPQLSHYSFRDLQTETRLNVKYLNINAHKQTELHSSVTVLF